MVQPPRGPISLVSQPGIHSSLELILRPLPQTEPQATGERVKPSFLEGSPLGWHGWSAEICLTGSCALPVPPRRSFQSYVALGHAAGAQAEGGFLVLGDGECRGMVLLQRGLLLGFVFFCS